MSIINRVGVISPMPQYPTWRTKVPLFVWQLACNLSITYGSTSSHAAASLAFRVYWHSQISLTSHKICLQLGAGTTEGARILRGLPYNLTHAITAAVHSVLLTIITLANLTTHFTQRYTTQPCISNLNLKQHYR
jgi:hypothetical protein